MSTGGIFVTGTDTGVGKTWVSTRLIEMLRSEGIDAVGMKPVECGGREDARALRAASGGATVKLDEINPYWLTEPVAPAAATHPVEIEFSRVRSQFEMLRRRHDFVVVEGAGGWLVPLDENRTMADLAKCLDLPVLLVGVNRLGVLNHISLTVRAIESSGLPCCGVFLNSIEDSATDLAVQSNASLLRRLLPAVPLFEDVSRLSSSL